MDNVIKLFIKYIYFLIPFTIGVLYAVYMVAQVTLYPTGFGDFFGLFAGFLIFLFGTIIGSVLQIGKSILDHEFRLSKITIIIIAVLILFGVYLLLNADLLNFTPGYKV